MVVPILNTGIEQRRFLFRFGVDTALEIQLEAVTTHTRQTQVVESCFSASRFWHNVVDFHCYDDHLLSLAVFAATTRPISDLLAQILRNVGHYAPSLSCFSTLCPRCFSSSSASERSSIW